MQKSIQRVVSDGALQFIDLAIQYIDKVNITVYVNDVPLELTGGVTPYTYQWIDATRIKITPVVVLGGIVTLRRATPTLKMYHVYDDGATFNDFTMDENFKQLLFIGQEAIDGGVATDFYTDVNIHGYRIKSSADGIEPTDLVTVRQYQADAAGAFASAAISEKWANNPHNSPVTPGKFSAYHWSEVARISIAGVQSFKGRAGAVNPTQDDYSSTMLSDSSQLIRQDVATGAVSISAGTTAQRPAIPAFGVQRANRTTGEMEWWNGVKWSGMGGSVNDVFYENSNVISADYIIPTGRNAMTAGPVTILDGVTVEISDGSVWSIV